MGNVNAIHLFALTKLQYPINVNSLAAYIMYPRKEPINVLRIGGYVITREPELPKNKTAYQALESLVRAIAKVPLPFETLAFGPPEPLRFKNRNTRVFVTVPDHPEIEGAYIYYDRVGLSRLGLTAAHDLGSGTTTHGVLENIRQATEILVSEEDFVEHPRTAKHVVLESTPGSYFFVPGEILLVGLPEEDLV